METEKDTIDAYVKNLFECRVISYPELLDYQTGRECPLIDACIEAFLKTIKSKV